LAFVRLGLVCLLIGAAGFGLAACGRAGPLELPPGPAVAQPAPSASAAPAIAPTVGGPVAPGPSPQETSQRNGFDAFGNPIAPPGQKKSFLLDPLLQ
jgi:predicted small lipoprotein YifL